VATLLVGTGPARLDRDRVEAVLSGDLPFDERDMLDEEDEREQREMSDGRPEVRTPAASGPQDGP
jgi:hypothetical protein